MAPTCHVPLSCIRATAHPASVVCQWPYGKQWEMGHGQVGMGEKGRGQVGHGHDG